MKHSFALRLLAWTLVATLTGSAAALAADPVKIDALLAQTGGAAFLGTEEAATLKLVEDVVNKRGGIRGRPVQFVVTDEQSNPQTAVSLMSQLLAAKPNVILGTGFTATCKATMPLVEEKGPVQYCITPGVQPKADSYVFSANISTHDLAPVTLRFFASKGWKKVALISSTDATGQDFETGFNEALARPEFKALELVAREHFNTTDISVGAQMARIKATAPQAVVLWSTGTGFGTLVRGFHDAGLEMPAAGGNGNLIFPQLAQYKEFMPKELYFAAPRSIAEGGVERGPVRDAQAPYFAAFKAAGRRPDIASTMAWDPAMIIIDALRKLGPDATAEQIKGYIGGLHGWAGINGVYDFRDKSQRGLGENNAIVLRYDAEKNDVTTVAGPGGRSR